MIGFLVFFAILFGGNHGPDVCHQVNTTASPTQYVRVSTDAWTLRMHSGDAGDIIPPIGTIYPGKNWTTSNRAIYNNGCVAP